MSRSPAETAPLPNPAFSSEPAPANPFEAFEIPGEPEPGLDPTTTPWEGLFPPDPIATQPLGEAVGDTAVKGHAKVGERLGDLQIKFTIAMNGLHMAGAERKRAASLDRAATLKANLPQYQYPQVDERGKRTFNGLPRTVPGSRKINNEQAKANLARSEHAYRLKETWPGIGKPGFLEKVAQAEANGQMLPGAARRARKALKGYRHAVHVGHETGIAAHGKRVKGRVEQAYQRAQTHQAAYYRAEGKQDAARQRLQQRQGDRAAQAAAIAQARERVRRTSENPTDLDNAPELSVS